MGRRSGLGRGLGALIPDAPAIGDTAEPSDGDLRDLPVVAIVPNRYQPRAAFEEEALRDLARSIGALGVLQPILVQRHHAGAGADDQYELIAGERRWRAAQMAGLTHIPAIVRSVAAQQSLEHALVENLQREDLNPVEEALAYRQLADEFELSHDEIAERVGRSRSAVTNTLRLLNLSPLVLELVTTGALGAGHGRALLAIEDADQQAALARRAASESWSVRRVEDEVKLRLASPAPPEGNEDDTATPAPDRSAALLELEGLLSDRLSTRVAVQLGGARRGQRGRVLIEFSGIEDLERIYRAIIDGPEA
jgi:ParB family chromosome partitioning protein